MFAIILPALVLMTSFVIDVGNWFEHKRHLQMQADSSALAAALDLRAPCSNDMVDDTAAAYGGRDYNPQIQDRQANVHMLINSQTYFGQTSPIDSTVDTDPPCTSLTVDVKLTETNLPWYFKLAQVPFINAHARVGLYTLDSYTGSLPLAVPEVDPKKVLAKFVDEDTGEVLATTPLTKTGTANGLTEWDNAAVPLPVKIDTDRKHVGVRIVVGAGSSTTCGDASVGCFDAGSANGLVHIRGWSAAGSTANPDPPLARGVTLEPGTCVDPYFTVSATACTIGVKAKVDFGPAAAANAKLIAVAGGKNFAMTYDATTGTWSSGSTIPVDPAAGPVPVTINWEVQTGTIGTTACASNKPCKGTFGVVQRSFGGSDARSGPLKLVQVSEGGVPGADSIERCSAVQTSCTHDFVVKVGLPPALELAQSVNDAIVELRFSGGGSQSQGLDCDTTITTFDDEIAMGCANAYKPNEGTPCPVNVADLWATPNPPSWECVANQTGQYVNKIPKGLNRRILCPPTDALNLACADPAKPTACTHPNDWSSFDTGLDTTDPRIVQLFVTEYGAFAGSGGYTVPITRFATFYVTGWNGSGGGFPNPCQGNGDDPAADGTIVGHFIKYIDTFSSSTATELCDLTDTRPCVPVMVE